MNQSDSPSFTTDQLDARVNRRQAFRIGGITLSLGAIVAACGENRNGDTDPGRVGEAPSVTDIATYPVNDAVLLRTASSLELTAVEVYNVAKSAIGFEGGAADLVDRMIADHTATASLMGDLTEEAGGTRWDTTNPWIMDRAVTPVLAAITGGDDPGRDVTNFAITLENLAASTHQSLTGLLSEPKQRVATAQAAAQESRHVAALVLDAFGISNEFSPALVGDEVGVTAEGLARQYAIATRFGSVAQQELVVGAADGNGARSKFLISTPAENSFIYEELG